jgi:hypothetical protein
VWWCGLCSITQFRVQWQLWAAEWQIQYGFSPLTFCSSLPSRLAGSSLSTSDLCTWPFSILKPPLLPSRPSSDWYHFRLLLHSSQVAISFRFVSSCFISFGPEFCFSVMVFSVSQALSFPFGAHYRAGQLSATGWFPSTGPAEYSRALTSGWCRSLQTYTPTAGVAQSAW